MGRPVSSSSSCPGVSFGSCHFSGPPQVSSTCRSWAGFSSRALAGSGDRVSVFYPHPRGPSFSVDLSFVSTFSDVSTSPSPTFYFSTLDLYCRFFVSSTSSLDVTSSGGCQGDLLTSRLYRGSSFFRSFLLSSPVTSSVRRRGSGRDGSTSGRHSRSRSVVRGSASIHRTEQVYVFRHGPGHTRRQCTGQGMSGKYLVELYVFVSTVRGRSTVEQPLSDSDSDSPVFLCFSFTQKTRTVEERLNLKTVRRPTHTHWLGAVPSH